MKMLIPGWGVGGGGVVQFIYNFMFCLNFVISFQYLTYSQKGGGTLNFTKNLRCNKKWAGGSSGGGQWGVGSNIASYVKIVDSIVNAYNLKTARDNAMGSSESYIYCYRQDKGHIGFDPWVIPYPQDQEVTKYKKTTPKTARILTPKPSIFSCSLVTRQQVCRL